MKKYIKCYISIRKWAIYYSLFDTKFHKKINGQMVPLTLRCAKSFFFMDAQEPKKEPCLIPAQTIDVYYCPVEPEYPKKGCKKPILAYFWS